MCLACEQDAVWIAYLESRGLLKPDDAASADALFAQFPVRSLPLQQPRAEPIEAEPIEAEPIEAKPIEAKPIEAEPIENMPAKRPAQAFSCDDPTAE